MTDRRLQGPIRVVGAGLLGASIGLAMRERGVDVVLDMVGADYAALNQAALNPFGRWVVIATQSGPLAEVDLARLMMKRISLTGSTLRSRPADEKARLIAAMEGSSRTTSVCPRTSRA